MAWIESSFSKGSLGHVDDKSAPKRWRWTGVAATVAGAATACRSRIATGPKIRLWEAPIRACKVHVKLDGRCECETEIYACEGKTSSGTRTTIRLEVR
jgi:hypothetical protein